MLEVGSWLVKSYKLFYRNSCGVSTSRVFHTEEDALKFIQKHFEDCDCFRLIKSEVAEFI